MDDRDFFDLLYQGWAKTTGAEDRFWMTEQDEEHPASWTIWAVDRYQDRRLVADNVIEADAAFITALHGCFGDLVKRLHDALDEADRLDERADEQEATIAGLAIENLELEKKLAEAEELGK